MPSTALHGSYTLSGQKTVKRTVASVPEEDTSAIKTSTAVEAAIGDGAIEMGGSDL